jgi:hypothetical protein
MIEAMASGLLAVKSRFTRSAAAHGGVGLGGEALLCPGGALNAQLVHQPSHLAPPHVDVPVPGRLPELPAFIDQVVLLSQNPELRTDGGIADRPRRGWSRLGVVVGGGGDLELLADRLDPPSTPIGRAVPMGDEGGYFVPRRSSSAPKKVAAAYRTS